MRYGSFLRWIIRDDYFIDFKHVKINGYFANFKQTKINGYSADFEQAKVGGYLRLN